MANLRILSDNAADRATLTASSTAGTLVAANLLTDVKSDVSRSTSTSQTITANWAAPEIVAVVAFPFCNFTSAATIRVRGYSDAGSTLLFDTGLVMACGYASLGMWNWGMAPLGVNAFSYGGGTYGRVWFAAAAVRQLTIDIADPSNPAGYVEMSRLVTGAYFSPVIGADWGASVTAEDASKQYRTDAGDLGVDIGPRFRKLSMSLTKLSPTERAAFWHVVRGSGLSRPMFISLYPESADAELEQTHQIYGRLSTISPMSAPVFGSYATTCEIGEN